MLRNWVFATNPNFIIPISQQPDEAYLSYFKLILFDPPEFIVWNIYGLRHLVLQKLGFKNPSLWQRLYKVLINHNLPWGNVRSHTKFGPDRFSRFDFYWIQKQTNKHTDKQSLYVYHGDVLDGLNHAWIYEEWSNYVYMYEDG